MIIGRSQVHKSPKESSDDTAEIVDRLQSESISLLELASVNHSTPRRVVTLDLVKDLSDLVFIRTKDVGNAESQAEGNLGIGPENSFQGRDRIQQLGVITPRPTIIGRHE